MPRLFQRVEVVLDRLERRIVRGHALLGHADSQLVFNSTNGHTVSAIRLFLLVVVVAVLAAFKLLIGIKFVLAVFATLGFGKIYKHLFNRNKLADSIRTNF